MNIRTPTDIDHAIAAACELHDIRAGQTGTAPPRLPSNPDRPSDKPPVEFEATEEDRILSVFPFITMTSAGRDFWAVEPTGNWATDCAVAKAHAATLAAALGEDGCSHLVGRLLLGWTLEAIAAKGNAAHMIGFASGVSWVLTRH
ncbi:hypothetical protein [Ancylobacter vacuolatus]|uniref:Uncharacterized protein n=1 Tax=Ancylobacter vacuolatus TaxID=223389 RepID=A0ABU0DLR9_9HYPH|nr:hypothetical protein [Ancylobacter vacuolatus]MDQ0349384.1 hypothetical protein [Ancylobacter vacuolatus]